jgi:hypothetical protein
VCVCVLESVRACVFFYGSARVNLNPRFLSTVILNILQMKNCFPHSYNPEDIVCK